MSWIRWLNTQRSQYRASELQVTSTSNIRMGEESDLRSFPFLQWSHCSEYIKNSRQEHQVRVLEEPKRMTLPLARCGALEDWHLIRFRLVDLMWFHQTFKDITTLFVLIHFSPPPTLFCITEGLSSSFALFFNRFLPPCSSFFSLSLCLSPSVGFFSIPCWCYSPVRRNPPV